MNIQYKDILTLPVDVDTTGRKVKVVISEMGSTDSDNDIIDHGAYDRTLNARGPKGANLIWHLTDHNPSIKTAIGKFSELYVDKNQLIGITDIPNTSWGNDVLELYKTGHINQHSVGFSTVKAEASKEDGGPRVIKEIKLYEGSAVLWGANPNTPTLEAGKGEIKDLVPEVIKELDLLMRGLKNGRYTDDTFELIEIRIKQLQDKFLNLVPSTLPVGNTPDPEKRFSWSNVLLNIQN
jgi:HK97 family phage prohead protease